MNLTSPGTVWLNIGMPHDRTTPTVTLDQLRNLAAIPLWHATDPSLAGVLGVGRATAYALAQIGRLVVPCPALLAMLGDTAHLTTSQTEPAGHTGCSHESPCQAVTRRTS
jgi:hypothetical protein